MSIEQQEPRVQTQSAATQRRYRTLAVVRQEAITRVEKPLEDSVFVWPHLMVREFFAATTLFVPWLLSRSAGFSSSVQSSRWREAFSVALVGYGYRHGCISTLTCSHRKD